MRLHSGTAITVNFGCLMRHYGLYWEKIWKLTNYLDITSVCVKNAVPNLYTIKLECVPNFHIFSQYSP